MSGIRTPVDRTEADAREWERNRVAWNLPRKLRVAPKPTPHVELRESAEKAAEDG